MGSRWGEREAAPAPVEGSGRERGQGSILSKKVSLEGAKKVEVFVYETRDGQDGGRELGQGVEEGDELGALEGG